MATMSLLDTRGNGRRNWLDITAPSGSAEGKIKGFAY